MSTFAYAALTARREEATPGTSANRNAVDPANTKAGKPGVGVWVDASAALVPAEVLGLHAFLIQQVTSTRQDGSGNDVVTVSSAHDAKILFWVLLGLAVVVYVFAHVKNWDSWDYLRMLIPPAAFMLWSTLQTGTAFSAVAHWSEFTRYLIGTVGVVVLGGLATALAYKADATD